MSATRIQRVRLTLLAGSLALASAATAQEGAHLSDAQIEANVLRALAGAPELSTQNIQSSTVYGTVTLTGNVHDEAMRTKAEDLVARASGVKKVVDELTLGDAAPAEEAINTPPPASQYEPQREPQTEPRSEARPAQQAQPGDNNQPPDDGNLAPADQATGNQPPAPYTSQQQPSYSTQQPTDNSQYPGGYGPPQNQQPYNQQQQPAYGQQQAGQPYGPPQSQYPGQQYPNQQYPNQQYPNQAQPYPGQPQGQYPGQQYPNQAQQYPGQPQQYPGQPPYGAQPDPNQPYGPPARRPMYQNPPPVYYPPQGAQQGGQPAGLEVTVPAGSMLRIRINRGLDSNHIQPGAQFDGIVMSDVAGGGAIAIPRGATVQGTVVDAKAAGALKGQGELGLQINSISLGGNLYPITTEVWQREGRDKSTTTVNSALGVGALGAIIGGIAGGGAGAAVGAGVGAGVGVAGAAGSPSGRVLIPPEAVLTFRIAQPAVVRTVSQQEMARLAYAAGQPYGQQPPPPPMRRYYSPYYGYYYAPYPYPR